MSLIPDASKKTLGKFITENIETGSNLITDGWKGYNHKIEIKRRCLKEKGFCPMFIE